MRHPAPQSGTTPVATPDAPPTAVPAEWWPAAVETLLAASGTGVGLLDRDFRYLYLNGVLAQLNGAPAAAHLGRTVREMIPAWADGAEPLLRQVLETGRAVTGLELSGLGDGRTYLAGYHPLRVEGRTVGIVGLVADVTEARDAEAALREQQALFSLLMENVPQAFFYVVDPAGPRLRYVSPAYERVFGRPAAELQANPGAWMDSVHPDDRPALEAGVERDRDQPTDVEYRVILPDGDVRRVRDRAFPVLDDAGELRWIAGVGEDVTEAHAAAERQAVLAAAGQALAASLDVTATLGATAELLVPRLADYCLIFTPDEEGAFAASVWRHADPAMQGAMARFAALHRVRGEPGSMLARAAATGETVLQEEVDVESLATVRLGGPERADLLRALAPRSVLVSGLTARGQRLGLMLIATSFSGRRYGPADAELVRQLADRIALALDNARLYGAEHAARAAAERSVERARAVQRAAAALNRAATPGEVAAVVVEEGRRVLRADAGTMALVDEAARAFQTLYSAGFAEAVARRFERFPLRAGGPLSLAVMSREPVFVESLDDMERRFPLNAATTRESGVQALCTLPLVSAERVLAGLTLGFHQPHAFSDDDRTFLSILAEQAAQALDRARVYEAEQESRHAAERSARHAEALRSIAAALNRAASADDVARVIVEDGVRALHADTGAVTALSEDRTEFVSLALSGYGTETTQRYARFPLRPGGPATDAVLTGEPVFVQSLDEMRARYPAYIPVMESTGLQAFAGLPLFSGGQTSGVVSYGFRAPRPFDADERTFLATLAAQVSQALDRARLYEAERAARAEAEAANRAKTEFLAVMSHELRTPLNAIDGYAELLEMGLRGPVTEAQRSDLLRIRRSQRHLLGLINDVLNFARLEAGHVELAIADASVAEIVEGLEALVAPQVLERGLAYDCPPADPSLVARADPEKVGQILLNLLSNAVKFTPVGGTVRVTARAEDGRVLIRVRDTGSGIPADRLESIFEPFVQLDRNLTSSHQGTGLGLAISRDLARAMGGDLAAESAVGEGSVFTLRLPRGDGTAGNRD